MTGFSTYNYKLRIVYVYAILITSNNLLIDFSLKPNFLEFLT